MSSIFSGYASYFTEQTVGRFLTSTAQTNGNQVIENEASNFSNIVSDQSFDFLKKFLAYTALSTVVAGSAFYIGYNYAKQRNRFDPRSREDDKTDQVINY